MVQVSSAELNRLAKEAERIAEQRDREYGGRPWIEEIYEAAVDVAGSHSSTSTFEEEEALAAAIMRVSGYEAKNPSGTNFGSGYDLPDFHGRGDRDFFF